MRETEITFYLRPGFRDPRTGRPRVVRLAVGQDIVWDMLPNPTTPRSAIGPVTFADLAHRMGVPAGVQRSFAVRELRIEGHAVPDLEVRMSRAVERLRVNGVLGLDVFQLFDSVLWFPRTGRITLRRP